MLRVTLLSYTVTVSILFLNLFAAIEWKIMYGRSDGLDGGSCYTWDIVMQVTSYSVASCLALCSGKRCATIFYTPSTRVCMGCYTWYSSDSTSLPPSPGSVAYRFNFDCEGNKGRYNISCYNWQDPMTWQEAKMHCSAITNRFLAVPETYAELLYIASWLNSQIPFSFAYIGLIDKDIDGTWKTIHGGVLNYTHWAYLEPNNVIPPEECLGFDTAARWSDFPCHWALHVICEKDMIAM